MRRVAKGMTGDIGRCGRCGHEGVIGSSEKVEGPSASMAIACFKQCRSIREQRLRENRVYSEEQIFWIDFAITAVGTWEPDSKMEIKLSEVLPVYKSVYCQLFGECGDGDEKEVTEMLLGKYRELWRIMYREDERDVGRRLGAFIHETAGHGAGTSVLTTVMGALDIVSYASGVPLPLKLVEDV
jgi:hypothetical protein